MDGTGGGGGGAAAGVSTGAGGTSGATRLYPAGKATVGADLDGVMYAGTRGIP